MKRNIKAVALVKAIKEHGVIVGYPTAGRLAGEENAQPRDWGQVCSLTDYACFISGLPVITLHYVRKDDGSINDASFQDAAFVHYKDEMRETAQAFTWDDAAYAKLMNTLLTLNSTDALSEWHDVINREARQPGFIRYQLDRAKRALERQLFAV